MRYAIIEILKTPDGYAPGNFAIAEEDFSAKFASFGGRVKNEGAECRAIRSAVLAFYNDAPDVVHVSTNGELSCMAFYRQDGSGVVYIDDASILFFYHDHAIRDPAVNIFEMFR